MSVPTAADQPSSMESAAERDRAGGARDEAADLRDEAAELRDETRTRRDEAGDLRDETAHARDAAGDVRDGAAGQRDRLAETRDRAAATRDQQADERDRVALRAAPERGGEAAGDSARAALRQVRAAQDAAGDREQAARDRHEGAQGRTHAQSDRGTASADRRNEAAGRAEAGADRASAQWDRSSGADGRVRSAEDRASSSADRGQASIDLTHASLDGLTGVYTRSAGLLEAQREIDRARRSGARLVLAFVDVDGLKVVNDEGGHAAGDRVLVRVADALKGMLRPYDLVIRYGGDEFLCVLTGVEPDDAMSRLQGVNVALAEGDLPASVSIGRSELRDHETPAQLIARADLDLYSQRQAGRARPAR